MNYLLVACCLFLCYQVFALNCGHFNSNQGATFDLTDLIRSADQPAYAVEDGDIPCTAKVEQNYTYMFNVCGTIASNLPVACRKVSGISAAGALQINKRDTLTEYDDYCYVVGAYSDSTSTLTTIDSTDPTKGLKLTYYGDPCHSTHSPRKFMIELQCADRLNAVPTHALEYATCEYTVTMPSVYGCPVECPVANRRLCGGNGHCGYDTDGNKARCFCNHGYSGADCNTANSSAPLNYSPVLLGLIITLFVIIALLIGSIVLMLRQFAAYKEDITNYQALKGDDDKSNAHV